MQEFKQNRLIGSPVSFGAKGRPGFSLEMAIVVPPPAIHLLGL